MSGIKPTEARRMVCFQGKEKRTGMRIFHLAGDTDNDATYDHEEDISLNGARWRSEGRR
jgi:hypothetical protein